MKYFTPELYVRFNSPDEKEVEDAHEQWERSIELYQDHLQAISRRLTDSVRVLANSLCLHDAIVLSVTGMPMPLEVVSLPVTNGTASLAVLTTRHGPTMACLVYLLAQQPSIHPSATEWPFSKDKLHWLYDEFDVLPNGIQQHEVLLSDGRAIKFQFHELQLIEHSFNNQLAVA